MSFVENATEGEWVGDPPNEKFVFSIRNMYIYVYKASITDAYDVDTIINVTNDKLATGAGLAAVIAGKAGRAMVIECSDYMRDNGPLQVTENFVSTAGMLPFKGIIHVVGPAWNNYPGRQIECAEDLFNTVYNALTSVTDRRWTSVALPAISSGRSGVPKTLCAEMYLKAFAEFAEDGPYGMKEIHFVDMNSEMIELVIKAHEKWYNNPQSLSCANASKYRGPSQQTKDNYASLLHDNPGNVASGYTHPVQPDVSVIRGGSHSQPSIRQKGAFTGFGEDANYNNPQSLSYANASKYREPLQQTKDNFASLLHDNPGNVASGYTHTVQPDVSDIRGGSHSQPSIRQKGAFTGFGEDARYKFKFENLRVYVYQCSVTEISGMDAITNSTIENLKHRCGVALEISKAAGEKMNADCTEYIRKNGSIKVTRNYISTPGRLQCRGIVHAVGPQWARYSGQQKECARDLYNTVINILVSVKQRNWRKVAMTAISSEHSGVPKQLCADMYVKAITDFAERGCGSVGEVHFVDIDKKILDMVVRAHGHWVKDPNSLNFEKANSY